MIPFLFFLALFLGFCMGAAPARACTTVLVGRDASETGEVLVGHNEDSGGRYVIRSHIVPALTRAPGRTSSANLIRLLLRPTQIGRASCRERV